MAAVALGGVVGYAWLSRPSSTPAASRDSARSATTSVRSSTPPTLSTTTPTLPTTTARLNISVAIDAVGALVVNERLARAATPGPVSVALPLRVGVDGGPGTVSAAPRVSDLRATYDGVLVSATERAGQRWELATPDRAGVLELTYRVSGVVIRSRPAPPGRAVVVIVSMLRELADRAPVMVTVSGPPATSILALDCPLATPATRVCGQRDGARWTAVFATARDAGAQLVSAQVNLPV